jgi:hypothetical protein
MSRNVKTLKHGERMTVETGTINSYVVGIILSFPLLHFILLKASPNAIYDANITLQNHPTFNFDYFDPLLSHFTTSLQ